MEDDSKQNPALKHQKGNSTVAINNITDEEFEDYGNLWHTLPFSNSEYTHRVIKLRSVMDKNNLDMIILTSMQNIAYYTGFIYCSLLSFRPVQMCLSILFFFFLGLFLFLIFSRLSSCIFRLSSFLIFSRLSSFYFEVVLIFDFFFEVVFIFFFFEFFLIFFFFEVIFVFLRPSSFLFFEVVRDGRGHFS